MTNEEILKDAVRILRGAIEKAIENGLYLEGKKIINYEIPFDNKIRLTDTDWEEGGYFAYTYIELIFSHQFAEAYWGDGDIQFKNYYRPYTTYPCPEDPDLSDVDFEPEIMPLWKICLQEMVLEEAPLKYIEKFL